MKERKECERERNRDRQTNEGNRDRHTNKQTHRVREREK